VDLDGAKKAEFVKALHEKTRTNIERKTEQYARQANKGRKEVVFEPGDWVWVHMRKERFPEQRHSKLLPRGDGPFMVLERVNNNAYKLDLPGKYDISATFNVSELTLFYASDDLRANPLHGGGNDVDIEPYRGGGAKDPLSIPTSSITRARAKQFRQAVGIMVRDLWRGDDLGSDLEESWKSWPNLIIWSPNI